jgi:hypothetical protein
MALACKDPDDPLKGATVPDKGEKKVEKKTEKKKK